MATLAPFGPTQVQGFMVDEPPAAHAPDDETPPLVKAAFKFHFEQGRQSELPVPLMLHAIRCGDRTSLPHL